MTLPGVDNPNYATELVTARSREIALKPGNVWSSAVGVSKAQIQSIRTFLQQALEGLGFSEKLLELRPSEAGDILMQGTVLLGDGGLLCCKPVARAE